MGGVWMPCLCDVVALLRRFCVSGVQRPRLKECVSLRESAALWRQRTEQKLPEADGQVGGRCVVSGSLDRGFAGSDWLETEIVLAYGWLIYTNHM